MKRDRKEISRLKREILQLRKMLEQGEQNAADAQEIIKYADDESEREASKPKIKCTKCKGAAELVDFGSRGTYRFCLDRGGCGHREKYK
jgi:hypothetical protein